MALIQATHAYNIIYVYCADDADHQGIVKIGKATVRTEPQKFEQMVPNCEALVRAANERIHEQTGTFGASPRLLHTELAHFKSETGAELQFYDTDVHQVLLNSGYTRHRFPKLADKQPQEWFDIAPEQLDIVKRAILAVKQGRTTIDGPATAHRPIDIVFRQEQLEAIEQTVAHFARPGKMLWNAKMRFGKTLCALEAVRRLGFRRTLILTHRPAVKSGWFEDFRLIKFQGYSYGSKPSANTRNGQPQVGERFDVLQKQGRPFIYFASMQDLRGSWSREGHTLTKNEDVFATPWDLVVIDEAHEGTTTALGQNVIHALQKRCKRFLYLSGTPYNILDQFRAEETYTWDYINEQEAKARWDNPSQPNPYEGLARLNIRTYNLGSVFDNYNHSEDDYFEFSEFFRTWTGREEQDGCPLPHGTHVGAFVHEKDVRAFLALLHKPSPDSYYPFSREAYRAYFAHTFWVVPGVREAAALSQLLQEDSYFKDFCVVNVAGEGDRMEQLSHSDDALKLEKQERDCLTKVKQAIATHERTITLSCGRLTTGVSIEQWTAVFLLSGAYHTKAASYLQTIFRAQTPFKHTPGIKTDCYAFDFAPDRTLTVIDEYIKTQARSHRPSTHNRLPLTPQTFLKYCSVIAIDGGRTVDYNAVSFMQQVNHVYAEHVIQKGFRDSRLYTGLFSVGEADLTWIADIGRIVGENGSNPKRTNGQVVVAQGGLDGSNATAGKNGGAAAKHPQGQQPSSSSLRPRRSLAEEARTTLRRVLDIVSVRLPMMIFGVVDSVETLTLAKFVDDIDANSWREFMPNGFTKGHFKRLLTFYNNDVFISSALHILSKAKEVDRLPITQRTEQMAALIATFHYPDKETVLTPWRVVNLHMASTLGGFDFFDDDHQRVLSEPRFVEQGDITQQVFGKSSARVLEINSKSGVYPLWVAYTLFRIQAEKASSAVLLDEAQARGLWKQVVETNLFVVCQTPMAEKITRRVLVGYSSDIRPNTKCFPDLIDALRAKDKKQEHRQKLISKILKPSTYGNPDMKRLEFSAVVGNPPYQLTNQGNGNGADSLYNLFLDLGRDLAALNTMIHPARFLFNAGKTPKPWNEAFLQSRHYRVVDYWANSAEVFPRVDVKGGIAITMYNRREEVEPIGFFSPFDELRAILKKVEKRGEASFSSIVGPRELYGLTQALYDEHPELESRTSKGHKYSLGANIFDLFPEVFLKECPKDPQEEMARIFGRHDNQRCFRWVKRAYITQPESFFTYKVVIPKANGSGAIGEVLSTPILGEPILGHTDTFLSIGQFANESEARACMKYIKTRFARTMLGTLKRTQDNPRSTWKNVPLQDFTSHSDIDWNLSVADIDKQLYAKYGLTNQEIAFVEEKVQAME